MHGESINYGHSSVSRTLGTLRAIRMHVEEIIEVVQHVALNILTNYTNNVAQTVIDFPEIKSAKANTCTTEGCGCGH